MSKFEDHIRKNRAQLDVEPAPPIAWSKLEDRLIDRPSRSLPVMRIAAALAICFAFGFAVSQFLKSSDHDQVAAVNLADYSVELAMVHDTYSPVIQMTIDEITHNADYATDTAHFSVFINQFRLLEQQNDAYLEELRLNGYRGIIVEELIKNYSYKLELLKALQQEIRKYNHQLKSIGYEKQPNYIAI